ncbi:DJ-1/PfpI family protein [Ekhidna lutea]|uniref:DJ-1/PfpI family protein n=1 Tax=Ekhidna lutea TaxID=447679 RepID=A0A239EL86_EKHLU|nr:DJ-1/PfpI family protein [Ekhidna lutea]SNS45028.1 DJ-1/PfpI family protein [Ekhidna lutea]
MRLSSIAFILIFFGSCQKQEKKPPIEIAPVAEGQSFNAAFLMIDGVYNSELMAPFDIFQHTIFHTDGGINVFTVAEIMDTITSFEGLRLLPDYSFDSKDIPNIDILVVPSAEHNMDTDLENEVLINWVNEIGDKADYVMSLCDGAFVLAKAGLVEGKESTTFPTDIGKYKETFPSLTVHENVSFVHHDNLLTSAGGAKSYDVALYLVHHLYGDLVAKGVGRGLVIDWDINDYAFVKVDK